MRIAAGKGFTLVELMVVLAIFGILAAIFVPTASSILPGYRLKAAAGDIKSNLLLSKITAIRRNTRCVMVFNPGTYSPQGRVGSYYVFLDTNSDWTEDDADGNPEEVIIPTTTMPAGVSLDNAVFVDNGNGQANSTRMFGFNSHGLAARATNGSFVYGQARLTNSAGRTVTIAVSPTGYIDLQ